MDFCALKINDFKTREDSNGKKFIDVLVERPLEDSIHSLFYSYNAFKKNQPWPPCDNFYEDDPLSQHSILGNDNNKQQGCFICLSHEEPEKSHQNNLDTLIVIQSGQARTGVNKWMYLKCLLKKGNHLVCPLTLKPLSKGAVNEIIASSHFKRIVI